MALGTVKIPDLQQSQPITTGPNGYPATWFIRALNNSFNALKNAVNGVILAQNAAAAAQASADSAAMAAAAAQASADSAGGDANANAREQALVTSGISPTSVLMCSTTTITIAAHTRIYGDGTSVAVSGDTKPKIGGAGTVDYVSYLDPSRMGGAVAYTVSTTPPVQANDVHVVGAVTVPAAGTVAGGKGPRYPGQVDA